MRLNVLIDRGISASKIDHIYNWCDEASMDMRPRDERVMEAYGLASRFNVLFAGTMGMQQGLASVRLPQRDCAWRICPGCNSFCRRGTSGVARSKERSRWGYPMWCSCPDTGPRIWGLCWPQRTFFLFICETAPI